MVQKVTTVKSIVALLYLIATAGPTLALPIADLAKPRDEHDITERDVLPRESAYHLLELANRGLADNFGNIIRKEAEPATDGYGSEVEARDPGVRQNAVAKRQPDMEQSEVEAREPGSRGNAVTKRQPDMKQSEVEAREPGSRGNSVTKRDPAA
jgi:hypothetical protein